MCPLSENPGSLNLLEPSWPVYIRTKTALPYTCLFIIVHFQHGKEHKLYPMQAKHGRKRELPVTPDRQQAVSVGNNSTKRLNLQTVFRDFTPYSLVDEVLRQ